MQKDFIENLRKSYEMGFLEGLVELNGQKYLMRTLNGIESLWRDRYSLISMNASFLSSRKVPTLAVAIRQIDGIPVVDSFAPELKEDANQALRTAMTGDVFDTPQFRAADELRKFLEALPEKAIDLLSAGFNEIDNKVEAAKKEVAGQEPAAFREEPAK